MDHAGSGGRLGAAVLAISRADRWWLVPLSPDAQAQAGYPLSGVGSVLAVESTWEGFVVLATNPAGEEDQEHALNLVSLGRTGVEQGRVALTPSAVRSARIDVRGERAAVAWMRESRLHIATVNMLNLEVLSRARVETSMVSPLVAQVGNRTVASAVGESRYWALADRGGPTAEATGGPVLDLASADDGYALFYQASDRTGIWMQRVVDDGPAMAPVRVNATQTQPSDLRASALEGGFAIIYREGDDHFVQVLSDRGPLGLPWAVRTEGEPGQAAARGRRVWLAARRPGADSSPDQTRVTALTCSMESDSDAASTNRGAASGTAGASQSSPRSP